MLLAVRRNRAVGRAEPEAEPSVGVPASASTGSFPGGAAGAAGVLTDLSALAATAGSGLAFPAKAGVGLVTDGVVDAAGGCAINGVGTAGTVTLTTGFAASDFGWEAGCETGADAVTTSLLGCTGTGAFLASVVARAGAVGGGTAGAVRCGAAAVAGMVGGWLAGIGLEVVTTAFFSPACCGAAAAGFSACVMAIGLTGFTTGLPAVGGFTAGALAMSAWLDAGLTTG